MRPIRDAMGVAGGVKNLPWLFTGTLDRDDRAQRAVRRPGPRAAAREVHRDHLSLLRPLTSSPSPPLLWLAGPAQTIWIGRAFFIWISVFNLFVVSVFWAMIVDVFDSEQGKRLFGFIAAGATLGAIVGSAVVVGPRPARAADGAARRRGAAARDRGVRRQTIVRATPSHPAPRGGRSRRMTGVGGSMMSGFVQTFSSVYLFNTAMFLLLFSLTSTLPLFRGDGRGGRGLQGQGRAHRILRRDRPRRERADAGRAAVPHRPHPARARRHADARRCCRRSACSASACSR